MNISQQLLASSPNLREELYGKPQSFQEINTWLNDYLKFFSLGKMSKAEYFEGLEKQHYSQHGSISDELGDFEIWHSCGGAYEIFISNGTARRYERVDSEIEGYFRLVFVDKIIFDLEAESFQSGGLNSND